MTEARMKDALISAYQAIADLGLTYQSAGNLSCRIDGGMLISCSGATANSLTPERIVKVLDDGSFDGDLRPSSEWRMHQAIYARRADANAVVHTHSDHCVALACNNEPLPGFHYMVGTFGGRDVPCVPYSTFGTDTLANDVAEAMTDRAACLLGSHGMISCGADLDTAIAHAERLEILCRQYLLARQLGEPALLRDSEWDEFFARAKELEYTGLV